MRGHKDRDFNDGAHSMRQSRGNTSEDEDDREISSMKHIYENNIQR
jgi:hypothetical protein